MFLYRDGCLRNSSGSAALRPKTNGGSATTKRNYLALGRIQTFQSSRRLFWGPLFRSHPSGCFYWMWRLAKWRQKGDYRRNLHGICHHGQGFGSVDLDTRGRQCRDVQQAASQNYNADGFARDSYGVFELAEFWMLFRRLARHWNIISSVPVELVANLFWLGRCLCDGGRTEDYESDDQFSSHRFTQISRL